MATEVGLGTGPDRGPTTGREADQNGAPNTGLLLFIPYRAMEQRVMTALADAGFEVSLAQARVFQRISPEGSRITELAAAAQVTKQTAGFLVDQLEAAGYVRRGPDPSDARAKLVTIAPRGAEAVILSAAVVAEVESEWAAHLGPLHTAQLRSALVLLRQLTDPYASG